MSHSPQALQRRDFLAATGVLGAVSLVPIAAVQSPAHGETAVDPAVSAVGRALDLLTRDTMSGLAVFVAPGTDPFSTAQGTPRREPGAVEAGTPDFLIEMLNRYIPFPDQLAVPLLRALSQGAGRLRLPAVRGGAHTDARVRRVDRGLAGLLENDATLPIAPVVALLLNLEAVRVDARALTGPFAAPFARLSHRQKAQVFRLLEGPDPALVALLDEQLPQPLRGTVSGLIEFLAGALLELTALGAYSEWAVFDPATRRLRGRPVGWRVSGYAPAIDGWPEHRGYYQGRTEATG